MFKIAKANTAEPFAPGSFGLNNHDHELLTQFSTAEGWIGDMASGVIKLGEQSKMLHGLKSEDCGLLSLMRCYDPFDRSRILELFEQAAALSSCFCFSTTITTPGGQRQPLFCMGESTGLEEKYAGSMIGVFVFPRFKLESGAHLANRSA